MLNILQHSSGSNAVVGKAAQYSVTNAITQVHKLLPDHTLLPSRHFSHHVATAKSVYEVIQWVGW